MAVDVVVRRVPLGVGPQRLDELRAHLNHGEREREARLLRPGGRKRFVAARGVLREELAERLGLAPAAVPIVPGRNGKPQLDPAAAHVDLRFNLSHSGDWALIALADGREVGVDIEQHSKRRDLDGLARRVLSDAELADWAGAATDDAREELFFALWTRKEAYAKGIGEGLGVVMRDLTLEPAGDPGRWSVRVTGEPVADWTVTDLEAPAGYSAALAVDG
jgi:4'-phosphopantetheinyl transferase